MERTDYDLLTLKDVAHALGRTAGMVRKMIAAGKFPEGFLAPDKRYWRWGDVRRWIDRQQILDELKGGISVQNRESAPGADSGGSGPAKRK